MIRAWLSKVGRGSGEPKGRAAPAPVLLMYHRVAEVSFDPWGLAVSPARFAEQIEVLTRTRRPLALAAFVARLEQGTLPDDAVAITFDGGYSDNLVNASPILARLGIPATLHLATGCIGQEVEYWWDELARLILGRNESFEGVIAIANEPVPIRLESRDEATGPQKWRAWEPPHHPRQALYAELWAKIRTLSEVERKAAMAELRQALGPGSVSAIDKPMTGDQIRALLAEGAFTLAGHSVSHPVLPALSREEQRDEIRLGKAICEQLAGCPTEGFAYPYGDFSEETKSLVASCGFRWACSTEPASIDRRRFDPFALPRRGVMDWPAEHFERWLSA